MQIYSRNFAFRLGINIVYVVVTEVIVYKIINSSHVGIEVVASEDNVAVKCAYNIIKSAFKH